MAVFADIDNPNFHADAELQPRRWDQLESPFLLMFNKPEGVVV